MRITHFNFRGNVITVDKNIGSTLYPHLQTLDMEIVPSSDTSSAVSPSNVKITFQDSIIQGNQGSDTFYGDIQNLSNNTSGSYNGFLNPVTVSPGSIVTTTDGNGNSITWGNDIYSGGNATPNSLNSVDTYNFTLLGDTTGQPVMQGNALITGFNLNTDSLKLTLSTGTFNALDGIVTGVHDKQITIADLDTAATFSTQMSQSSLSSIDPLFVQYLLQTDPNQTIMGTTITFDGGGSLSFAGNNDVITDFSDISNFTLGVDFSYKPVVALQPNQIISAHTPTETSPFVYGEGPEGPTGETIGPYFNELDNYFANSVFATYSVTLPTQGINLGTVASISPTQVTTFGSTFLQNGATTVLTYSNPLEPSSASSGNVTIDPFGTITVTNNTPILADLTIVATDQQGHTDQTTQLFGFLDAPITSADASDPTITGLFGSSSNILSGVSDSLMVGEFSAAFNNYALTIPASGNIFTAQPPSNYGSNLIIDTGGAATAYGDFESINFNSIGTNGVTYAPNNALTPEAGLIGGQTSQDGNTINFLTNAFYVTGIVSGVSDTVYGVAGTFTINATGGGNLGVTLSNFTQSTLSANFDDSGQFDYNQINFGSQTIYGQGVLYGDLNTLNINIAGGTNNSFGVSSPNDYSNFSSGTTLNGSGDVLNNTFTFSPTYITVQGDVAGNTTTIYGSIANLNITEAPIYPKEISATLTNTASTSFSGNQFIFDSALLTGGLGTNIFYGSLESFGNPYNYAAHSYNGFVDGGITTTYNNFTTSSSPSLLATGVPFTITDPNNNSITFNPITYTGGQESNTYNFTIVQDNQGFLVMEGYDTITNFNPNKDTIVFNISPNLYHSLGMDFDRTGMTQLQINQKLASIMDSYVFVGGANGFGLGNGPNTTILFNAPGAGFNGDIDLENSNMNVTSLNQMVSTYQNSLIIESIPGEPTYTAPSVVVPTTPFDPVFANITQPGAFASFVRGDPLALSYNATYSVPGLSSQIALSSTGTLSPIVGHPIDTNITVTATSPTNTLTLPVLHIFVSNASFIYYDNSSSVVNGSTNPGAYEVTAGTVYGGGGGVAGLTLSNAAVNYGSNLIYDMSATTHAIYGDVASISDSVDTTAAGHSYTYVFNANLMNINSGHSDSIYGNAQSLTITAPATPGDATSNTFTFGSPNGSTIIGNTIYGTGAVFGDLQNLILDGTSGNGTITSNMVTFGNNTLTSGVYLIGSNGGSILTGGAQTTNLYAGIGSLVMDENGSLQNQIADNTFKFGNSVLSAVGRTNFYGDIADLSQTDFVTGPVSLGPNTTPGPSGVVQILDDYGNSVTWGNDTFIGNNIASDTFNFTLLGTPLSTSLGAVMQGNATIKNFNSGSTDTLNFLLTPALFKELDTTYNRTVSSTELGAAYTTSTVAAGTLLSFTGAGSILFENSIINPTLFTASPIYTPAPITIANTTPAPLILTATGGNNAGSIYGNVLDNYFNHVDIGNTGSTYSYTSTISGLTVPSGLFDQYGTAQATPTTSPTLYDITVTPNDVHFPSNVVTLPLMVGTFDPPGGGYIPTDPNTTSGGTFTGSATQPSLLQGQYSSETMIGNEATFSVVPTTPITQTSLAYGINQFGNNMIINTNSGTIAYGDFSTIDFNVTSTLNGSTANTPNITGSTFNFGSNALDVTGTVYGVANTLNLTIQGVNNDTNSNFFTPIDNSTNFLNNTLTFGNQTIFGQGVIYGDLNVLDFNITAGTNGFTSASQTLDVSANVTNNIFSFGQNQIVVLGSTPSALYAGIGSLQITETNGTPATPFNQSAVIDNATFSGNAFIFGNTTEIAGSGSTNFYGDIADLSQTDFVTGPVSFGPNNTPGASGIVEVEDAQGNTITWGNDTFIGKSPGLDTFNFTLLGTPLSTTTGAVMQGNATIENFHLNSDILNFLLTPTLFKELSTLHNPTYDRVVTGTQLEAAYTTSIVAAGTLLSFTGAGSILFEHSTVNPTLFTTSLSYTPASITIANTTPAPLILTATGGNNGGSTYGNVLDNYFNHVDIGNTGSTYSYTSTFSELTVPSGLFDQYGTAQATPTSAPTLYDITVTPNDVHFPSNVVNFPLIVGTFDPPGGGYIPTDPNTTSGGTFTGSATQPSLLQGQYSSETMVGNESTFSVAPTTSLTNQTSLFYGINELGNNMLINTNSGTIAYGDAQTINFNVAPTNSFDSHTNTFTITTPNITGSSFDLGSNSFDITGTAYGAAQTFNIAVHNYDSIVDLPGQGITFVGANNVNFDNNIINIGPQTIFGQGILYGDIGVVNFTVQAGSVSSKGWSVQQEINLRE